MSESFSLPSDNKANVHVDTSNNVYALIIGTDQTAKRLEFFLKNKGLETSKINNLSELDLSRNPDFVFWFPVNITDVPDEKLLNFSHNAQFKTIIICQHLVHLKKKRHPHLDGFIAHNQNSCQVIISDLYGPYVKSSPFAVLWSRLKENIISLPENDHITIAPLYLDDAVDGICKIAFSSQTYGQTYLLRGSEEMSILSLSFIIREELTKFNQKLPQISNSSKKVVEYLNQNQLKALAEETENKLSWRPKADFSEGIRKLVIGACSSSQLNIDEPGVIREAPNRDSPHEKKTKKKIKFSPRSLNKKIKLLLFLAVGLLFFKLFSFGSSYLISTKATLLSESQLESLSLLARILGAESALENAKSKKAAIDKLASIENHLQEISDYIFNISEIDPGQVLDNLWKISSDLLVSSGNETWRTKISRGREFIPVANWALGLDKKRTFLIVIQNSSELRPTGGFISAVGFLTIDRGRLLDLNFIDIYQIDAQLTGQQDPPAPIAKYLGESSWWARDANWDPDVVQTARTIQNFVIRATGRKTDGVIMLNSLGLQSIIKSVKSVNTFAGSTLTADNILVRSTFSDELNTATGARKDLLVDAVMALKDLAGAEDVALNLTSGIIDAVNNGDLQIYSSDINIAGQIAILQADGSIQQSNCPVQFQAKSCLMDSTMVVDANMGVNRADYFVRKKRQIDVFLSATNSLEEIITLNYANDSETNSLPGGIYKNYVRVLVPINASIELVSEIAGEGQVILEPEILSQGFYQSIGWFIQIPPGSEKEFRLKLSRPVTLPLDNGLAGFNLLLQKQPGNIVPTIVRLSIPDTLFPLAVSHELDQPVASQKNNFDLSFSLDGKKSENIAVEFASVEKSP